MAAVNVRLNPLGAVVLGMVGLCVGCYIFDIPGRFSSIDSVGTVSMRQLLSVSIDLAQKGGVKVVEVRKGSDKEFGQLEKGKTNEGAAEYMTQGDLKSHRVMIYGYKKAFPTLNVISEEHDNAEVDMRGIAEPQFYLPEVTGSLVGIADEEIPVKDITVWIDPLDATQEYTENLLQYVTTMTCVAVNGEPIIGVIHLPFGDGTENSPPQTFWGWVGHKYSPNLQPVEHAHKDDDPFDIIVSRSHTGDVQEIAKKALGENTKITPAGGAGYKTLQVIKGINDAYTHSTTIKKWDICAGNAILHAVGGQMTDLHGAKIDYGASGNPKNTNGLLATTHHHSKLQAAFEPAFNEAHRAKRAVHL